MENFVFVYKDPRLQYLIVKRHPFSYQIHTLDREGYEVAHILQGNSIPCPVWTDRTVHGKYVFAKVGNNLYEISDLEVK